jgi:hypothetical protein
MESSIRIALRLVATILCAAGQGDLTATEGATLQSDPDHINRAASVLPMRRSDMFFPCDITSTKHERCLPRAWLRCRANVPGYRRMIKIESSF